MKTENICIRRFRQAIPTESGKVFSSLAGLCVFVLALTGLAFPVQADSITVPNGDFEDWLSIGNDSGKWSSESDPNIEIAILANDEFWSNPASFGSGWTSTGVQPSNGKYGLQHPKKSSQQDMTAPFNGDFVGFMNLTEGDGVGASAGTVESGVLGQLAAGAYQLTVAVGARPSGSWNDVTYTISLISGGNVLGTPSSATLVPSTAVLGSNTQDLVHTVVIPATSPLIGQDFAIRIGLANAGTKNGVATDLNTFTQANFDNVRLETVSITTANTPGPEDDAEFVQFNQVLTWIDPQEPNDEDVTYNVYFGTDPDCDLNPQVITDEDTNQYDPPDDLDPNTTYYWRVDVIDPNGGGTPIIVQGECWMFTTIAESVDLDVDKVRIKAGKDRDLPEDMIIIQGDLDVEEAAYSAATSIRVRISTDDLVGSYERTIPAPSSEEVLPELKNGSIRFKGVGDPDADTGQFQLQLQFNRNGRTGKYKIIGKKIDLSGLEATGANPLVIEVLFGGFSGVAELVEDADDVIINSKQSMPMCLLSGLKDKVGVDKVVAKPDQVKINKGQISALNPDLDLSGVDVTVFWDLFDETIPAGGLIDKGNGKFIYTRPRDAAEDLKIKKLQIDLNKCMLKLQIVDGENLTSVGSAIFGLQAGVGGSAFDASIVVDLPD